MLGMRTCSRNANWIRANIPKSCHKPLVSLLYATKSAFTALNVCCACALDHVMQIGFGQISPSASSTRDLGTRLVLNQYNAYLWSENDLLNQTLIHRNAKNLRHAMDNKQL